MTDITSFSTAAPGRRLDLTSDSARKRIRARYRAEARFKSYGIAALTATTLFVVMLLGDIFVKGLPTFFEHSVLAEVDLRADAFGSSAKPTQQEIAGADYFPITRDAIKSIIPGIESRSAERTLTRLLSVGAANDLRQQLLANPSLIGTKVKTSLLLSDDADLYFKGQGSKIAKRPGRGTATPSDASGEVTILTSSNDFAEEVLSVKRLLDQRSRDLTAEANRIEWLAGSDSPRVKELRAEAAEMKTRFEDTRGELELTSSMPSYLVEIGGGLVKATTLSAASIKGEVLLPLREQGEAKPGGWRVITYATPENARKVTDQEIAFLERLRDVGAVQSGFNWRFFSAGDSREAELAGIRGAFVGTVLMLAVTLALCLPIGVMAAVYLEEFAPKNIFTDILEVNINNLAAVPSIVFGLLGLAVFLNAFDMPRSAPLVGGLVMALLVLPTIIIASRAALKAVPPSIKEAALGVGASHQQAVFHHVLPLAMPGIMTGTIIGMAHALGETAPLLMIGMVAFVVDVPQSFTDSATVLPVQIYLWSDLPEAAFQARTAGAIVVLLGVLFLMNGTAIWLRKRFERRW